MEKSMTPEQAIRILERMAQTHPFPLDNPATDGEREASFKAICTLKEWHGMEQEVPNDQPE